MTEGPSWSSIESRLIRRSKRKKAFAVGLVALILLYAYFPDLSRFTRPSLPPERTIEFTGAGYEPLALAKVYIRNWGSDSKWRYFSHAKGRVTLPRGCEMQIHCNPYEAESMDFLGAIDTSIANSLVIEYNDFEGQTYVTDEMLGLISRHRGLRELVIYEAFWLSRTGPPKSKITDQGLIVLKELSQLRRLRLTGRGITDAAVDTLGQLHDLRTIDFVASSVSPEGKRKLERLIPGVRVRLEH